MSTLLKSAAVASLLSFALATLASAVSITSNSNTTGFATSTTDLIEGLSPTSISGTGDQEGLGSNTSGTGLTNGLFAASGVDASTDLTIVNNGAQITYTLPGGQGYFINEIDTYNSWRDGGRANQNYSISYATISNPSFTLLTNVNQSYSGGNPTALQVLVTGIGLTDVTQLQFNFASPEAGYVGYREIDVFGSVSSPEPGSLVLFGLGAVGLPLAARRRRKA